MVAALRAGRVPCNLRLPRLQGAFQDLLHNAAHARGREAHHAARHGQLQREDGQALHRSQLHHHRRGFRPGCRALLPQHAAGKRVGRIRGAAGRSAADKAHDPGQSGRADPPGARGQALRGFPEGQFHNGQGRHRKDCRGVAGGRERNVVRARHLLPGARGEGRHRQRARRFHRGQAARAQPHLLLRHARRLHDIPEQRRPDDAQPEQARGDCLADSQRAHSQRHIGIHRRVPSRHRQAARIAPECHLHAARRLLRFGRRGQLAAGLRCADLPDRPFGAHCRAGAKRRRRRAGASGEGQGRRARERPRGRNGRGTGIDGETGG